MWFGEESLDVGNWLVEERLRMQGMWFEEGRLRMQGIWFEEERVWMQGMWFAEGSLDVGNRTCDDE